MLSIIKTIILSLGAIYNSSYDNINGTIYPNHTDYIRYIELNNETVKLGLIDSIRRSYGII